MKKEQFEKAMDGLDEKYAAEAVRFRHKKSSSILRWGAVAACAVVIFVAVVGIISSTKAADREELAEMDTDYVYYAKEGLSGIWTQVHDNEMSEDGEAAQEVAEAVPGKAARTDSLNDGSFMSPAAETAAAETDAEAKIIFSAGLTIESKDFDGTLAAIEQLVEQNGGYFEEKSIYEISDGEHQAELTVRVPQESFEALLSGVRESSHVTYFSQSADDVSESYYDLEARLKTQRLKLERLQELLAQADNMSDIITIEDSISNVEWQIEWMEGDLRAYDSKVDYSTVTIRLNEVQELSVIEPEPVSFLSRLGKSFADGFEAIGDGIVDFVYWFVSNIIWLAIIAAAVVVLVKVIRKKRRGL